MGVKMNKNFKAHGRQKFKMVLQGFYPNSWTLIGYITAMIISCNMAKEI